MGRENGVDCSRSYRGVGFGVVDLFILLTFSCKLSMFECLFKLCANDFYTLVYNVGINMLKRVFRNFRENTLRKTYTWMPKLFLSKSAFLIINFYFGKTICMYTMKTLMIE